MSKSKNNIKQAISLVMLATASLFSISNNVSAHDHAMVENSQTPNNAISVVNGYVRATIPGTDISAAYMTIKNSADKTKTLVSVSGEVSKRIELHEHTMADGMMKMRQVAKIDVAAQSKTLLQPSGLHIMIFNLTKPLQPATEVKLTLTFADGDNEVVVLPVKKLKTKKHHH